MRHLRTYKIFEKYGVNTTGIEVPSVIKDIITAEFGWNRGIESSTKMACNMARDIVDKGSARINTVKSNTNENLITKTISNFYFGRNMPKITDEREWSVLRTKWTSYWRGISKAKHVDNLKYGGGFVGAQHGTYHGTWITSDKDYATGYSDKSDPTTLIEILISPTAKIVEQDDLQAKSNKLRDLLKAALDENMKSSNFDQYTHHAIKYVMDYLVANSTWIAIASGYDCIWIEPHKYNQDVMVVMNKEKMAIKA